MQSGAESDVLPITGPRADMTQSDIDELNNETASTSTFMGNSRHQPFRAAKKRPFPSADDTPSEFSTASDPESIATQYSQLDTDISETSSIGWSAPKCKLSFP